MKTLVELGQEICISSVDCLKLYILKQSWKQVHSSSLLKVSRMKSSLSSVKPITAGKAPPLST